MDAPSSPPSANVPDVAEHEEVYTNIPVNKGRSPPFSVLTGLYERLSNENKHDLRKKLLANWFRKWREEVGCDLYPVLRLLLPQRDRERAVYNIKEKTLAKIYIRLIPLNVKDSDAVRLMNWKRPTEKEKAVGDFPMVLADVISKRSNVMEGSLNVERINKLLDELSKAGGKLEQQVRVMTIIYNNCTPAEQKWIVRIILKDLNILVKEATVLSVFHEDAIPLFNTCSDLKRVAYDLSDPAKRLNDDDKTVKLFHAFAPMLCKRPTKRIEDTVKLFGGVKFLMEEKLDGERIQLHKQGNEYFYCSRKGKDYTYLYGKTVGDGSLTPYIDSAFDPRVTSLILDGEMLVWDPVTEKHLPFGTLKTAALDKSQKENRPRPCFKIFDLLYLNGISLIDKRLSTRKKNMRAYVSQVPGRMEYVEEFEGKTAKDVRTRMNGIIENRGEGLILKNLASKYTLNGRNVDFIKVKPEYMDNMGETVDVLVVAGNYGSGKRGGGVSTLICAVRDDRSDVQLDADEPRYSSFVRIGSGLTFADYVWIRAKPWKPWTKDDPPSFYQTAPKGVEDKGDVYLEPEDSFIVKVKAAEIVSSDLYHLNLTMRFPRALAIRDDLGIEDCLTATALFESIRDGKKRKYEDQEDGQKRRRTNVKKSMVVPQFQGANVKDVQVESDLFEDMKFQVTPDPQSSTAKQDKNDIEIMIYKHGGDFAQMVRPDTTMVVYDGKAEIPFISNIKERGQIDIIRSKWIKDCISKKSLVSMGKHYFFHATDTRQMDEDYEDTSSIQVSSPEKTPPRDTSVDGKSENWFSQKNVTAGENLDADTNVQQEEETDNDSENASTLAETDITDLGELPEEISRPVEHIKESFSGLDDDTKGNGSDQVAAEYDPDAIFRHLRFYLDTSENASRNDLPVDRSYNWRAEIEENFEAVKEKIIEYGGKLVDLSDPSLTHVLYDKRDDSRRIKLIRKTSEPKRRYVIMTDWVFSSIEEGALLDEAYFT